VGEPLRPPVLRGVAAPEVVTSLERHGVITSRGGTIAEVRLVHPLFGEVVRNRVPTSRLNQIQLSLADAVEAGEPTAAESFRAAVWRADAGDHDAFLLEPVAAERGSGEDEFTFHRAKRIDPGHKA